MNSSGRNAPCPCGSGKKYKTCCLRTAWKGAASNASPQGTGPGHGLLQPVAPPAKKVPQVIASPQAREMDDEALAAIQNAMQKLKLHLAREHGLILLQKKHTYSKWKSRIELEVAIEREDGVVMDGHAESFLERCSDYGLAAEDLGRPFRHGDKTFRIIGLRPRAAVSVICEQLDPKPTKDVEHRFRPSAVRHYLHECPDQTAN